MERAQADYLFAQFTGFREGCVGLDELQTALWSAAQSLTSRTERQLRERLEEAESGVERIRFTVDAERVQQQVTSLIDAIEVEVRSALAQEEGHGSSNS